MLPICLYTPICSDAPLYVWIPPLHLYAFICLYAPIHLDAPYIWTPPICSDAPHTFVHPHMFRCFPVGLDVPITFVCPHMFVYPQYVCIPNMFGCPPYVQIPPCICTPPICSDVKLVLHKTQCECVCR